MVWSSEAAHKISRALFPTKAHALLWSYTVVSLGQVFLSIKKDVTKTGNGERGTGSGERKSGNELSAETSIYRGNLQKNPIWPMIDDREPSKQT